MEKTIRSLYYDSIRKLNRMDECKEFINERHAYQAIIEIGKYLAYLFIFKESGEQRLYDEAMRVFKDTKETRLSLLTKYENFLKKLLTSKKK